MAAEELARDFKKRLEKLQGQRSNFDAFWQDVQALVWPSGVQFLEKDAPGERKTQRVYDMHATRALEKFAAAMESFLTPRFAKWHGLRATNADLMKDREVKVFFEKLTDTLFQMRNSPTARFYGQMHEDYKSLGAYGNGCIYIDENPKGRGVRYRHIPIAQAWIEVDHNSVVDTVYYRYMLTAKAARQKWPWAVPERAQFALEQGNDFEEHAYLHVVRPNSERDPQRADAPGMPFQGYDIALDEDQVIPTEGGELFEGFAELPYIWSRYTLNPCEKYGRGPGMMCLPDIQTLQEMQKTFLRSGHKVADPPLLVAADGRLGRGMRQIRISPGGLNYGGVDENGRSKIVPLHTGARLDITRDMQMDLRDGIDDAFLVKLFDILAQDRVEMTATEVLERAKEKGQLVTPVVGRQQSERLGPTITREIGIAQRQGVIGAPGSGAYLEIPDLLAEAEGEFEIEYDSTATRMQSADEVAAFQRMMELFSPAANLDPTLMQVPKMDDAIRVLGEQMGVRPSLFNSENEMNAIRERQAQMAQTQAAAEAAPGVAQAAKTVSEI